MKTGEVADLSGDIFKVPVQDLISFGGIVAEDVMSVRGSVIIPKGTRLAMLGDSMLVLMRRLLDEGICYIHVRREDHVEQDALDSFIDQVMSSNVIIDPEVANRSITEVKSLFESIRTQRITPELMGPISEVAKELLEQILTKPKILFSVAKVRHWDEYTFVHSFNTAAISGFLAHRMASEFAEIAVLGGLLHDLGKARIPLEILNKPGPLTEEEFNLMKTHPLLGEQLARELGIDNPHILAIIRSHHERWSGAGYPDGKRGEDINFLSRIVAVADAFDAMTSERSYKQAVPFREAVNTIILDGGTHFDPKVSRLLLTSFGMYPPGSVVELSDKSIGVVVSSGGEDLLRPVVMIKVNPDGSLNESLHLMDLKRSDLRIRRYLGWEGKRAL
ncbi:MAG: HD-GYP domain-containing protein [Thermanaerothrix sp.]|nr:HD-GYP domain-containing protein [Thermanaerothrix sp.]